MKYEVSKSDGTEKTHGADWLAHSHTFGARVLFFLSSEARGPAFSPYLLQLMQPISSRYSRYSYFTCVPHPLNQS